MATKLVQIRNVPEDLHRRLKQRAAEQGITLSDYLRQELQYIVNKPTLSEMRSILAEGRSYTVEELGETPAEAIRNARRDAGR